MTLRREEREEREREEREEREERRGEERREMNSTQLIASIKKRNMVDPVKDSLYPFFIFILIFWLVYLFTTNLDM
jgi:hypothetical protein